MKIKEQSRQSNFELMRIIAMMMIIVWHIIIHGRLIENTAGITNLFLNFLLCICIIHVNSFALLMGYFQYEKEFSLRKFLKLFNSQWFYKIVFAVLSLVTGLVVIGKMDFILEVLPIGSRSNYWFINCYLTVYLLSPFLNKFIVSIDKKEHRRCLIICFILFSVIAYITHDATIDNNGSTIIQFIFLYLLGSYLHKYPIKENMHFKKYSKQRLLLIFSFGFIFLAIINFLIQAFAIYTINMDNSVIKTISSYIVESKYYYSSPVTILQTVCFFLFFETLSIKSKFINFVSSTTLGIYLIHDNSYVRSIIYKAFSIDMGGFIYSKMHIIYALLMTFVIFFVCSIIEMIRLFIFRKISKSKIVKKYSGKFYLYLEKIKL